jgi:phosphate/sulfate permease
MQAEQSIKTLQNPKSTPDQLRQAAVVLEAESARLKPGEFREAFQTLSAKAHAVTGDAEASQRLAALAAAAKKVGELSPDVPMWIKIICSLTMAAGTMAGGWRIIKTLGHKMVKLQPVHGFAAEATAATLLAVTGSFGMTVSTTHSITTSIMGVGCAKRFSALKFSLIERILWAWVLTLPAAGGVAYLLVKAFRFCGWIP